jgi:hypothetical protein
MTEQPVPPPAHPICPWCSVELPSAATTDCPSCGAILVGEPETAVPGVTAIDAEAIVRNARAPVPERRSRLLGWITGDEGSDAETPAPPGSLEPPPPAVRREMLRMELEAEVAELQAEVGALASEARDAGLEEAQDLEAVADDAAVLLAEVTAGSDGEAPAPTAGAEAEHETGQQPAP